METGIYPFWDQLAQQISLGQLARFIESGTIDAKDINALQATEHGSESLRLIVRDNIQGQAETIASALWHGLR